MIKAPHLNSLLLGVLSKVSLIALIWSQFINLANAAPIQMLKPMTVMRTPFAVYNPLGQKFYPAAFRLGAHFFSTARDGFKNSSVLDTFSTRDILQNYDFVFVPDAHNDARYRALLGVLEKTAAYHQIPVDILIESAGVFTKSGLKRDYVTPLTMILSDHYSKTTRYWQFGQRAHQRTRDEIFYGLNSKGVRTYGPGMDMPTKLVFAGALHIVDHGKQIIDKSYQILQRKLHEDLNGNILFPLLNRITNYQQQRYETILSASHELYRSAKALGYSAAIIFPPLPNGRLAVDVAYFISFALGSDELRAAFWKAWRADGLPEDLNQKMRSKLYQLVQTLPKGSVIKTHPWDDYFMTALDHDYLAPDEQWHTGHSVLGSY